MIYLYSALYWLYRVPIGFIRMVKLSPYESVMVSPLRNLK